MARMAECLRGCRSARGARRVSRLRRVVVSSQTQAHFTAADRRGSESRRRSDRRERSLGANKTPDADGAECRARSDRDA
jgi:hypothetical protein